MRYILLIAWIFPAQPPTQIEFEGEAAALGCALAKAALEEDAVKAFQKGLGMVQFVATCMAVP